MVKKTAAKLSGGGEDFKGRGRKPGMKGGNITNVVDIKEKGTRLLKKKTTI